MTRIAPSIFVVAAVAVGATAPQTADANEHDLHVTLPGLQATQITGLPTQHQTETAFLSGTYFGRWHDGRQLFETMQMVTPDMITMQRHDYSSTPVTFRRVGPNRFRNESGGTLTVLSPTQLRWTNSSGANVVSYNRIN